MRTVGVHIQFFTHYYSGTYNQKVDTIKIRPHNDQAGESCREAGTAISPNVVFAL